VVLSARRAYQLSGLVGLLVAVASATRQLVFPTTRASARGPGFFPRWLCGVLALLSLVILVRATGTATPPRRHRAAPTGRRRVRIVGVVVALFLVAAVTTTLGFRLTMLTFYLAVIGMLGRWRWIETPVLAVLGSFAAYYILVEWLKLPLPVGALGF
jgi:hypothetical protein